MKKNIKTVSYILVLGALLSSVPPVVAQTNWFNRGRAREAAQKVQEPAVEAIASLEARIKNLLGQLDEYRQCIMSEEGCLPEQKATLRKAGWGLGVAVITLLLYLFRRHEAKQREQYEQEMQEGEQRMSKFMKSLRS